jgi:hypothetical protein
MDDRSVADCRWVMMGDGWKQQAVAQQMAAHHRKIPATSTRYH